MKQFLVFLSIAVLNFSCKSQSIKPAIKDWHLLDFKEDGYRGISLKQAYELLKNKKSETVIVAVIDSGIDTLQEDLKPVFWKNPKEIPNNNSDDDKNGLIDDAIGWNYLGGANKENLSISVPEPYRTYHRFKNAFENAKEKNISKENLFTYKEWKRSEKIINSNYESASKEIDVINQNIALIKQTNEYLKKYLKKDVFKKADLSALPATAPDSALLSKRIWLNIFGVNDFANVDFVKDYESYKKELDEKISFKTTMPVDYRGKLLKDDGYEINKKYYGNNNLQTYSGYHGTSVSSIIGAVRNNAKGLDGIADNVRLMMIRAGLGKDEYDKDVAIAIRYAVDNGAKVINISLGKPVSPDKKWVDDAVKYALSKDVVIIHASGNDAQNNDVDFNYPSAFSIDETRLPNFLNVGASGDKSNGGLVAPFSNYGKKTVDIFAPGVDINCAIANNGTQLSSGTSMASPVTAGIVALLRSYFPKLSAAQIVEIIKKSGAEINEDVLVPGTKDKKIAFKKLSETGKIVNAYEAIKLALTY
jgi:subtilisin family serine protease